MRCPDCNKFVSNEEVEPEVNSLEIDDSGAITADVRIVNACADCGTELTEATFDFSGDSDDVQSAVELHIEETKDAKELTEEERLVERGCDPHVLEKACDVCGWNGTTLLPPRYEDITIEEFDPPVEHSAFGKIVAKIEQGRQAVTTCLIRENNEKDLAELEQYRRDSRPSLPVEKRPVFKPDTTVHELTIDESGAERTERSEGKGRGRRTFYGASISYHVYCSCGGFSFDGTLDDDIQASGMDELN